MLACFLSACGGGGGNGLASAHLVPAPVATQSAKQGTITIKITVPGPSTAKTPRLKRILDTASSTMGILFTVYPHAGNPATQAVAVSGDDISGDSGSACTPSGVGVARSCSVQIAAPAVSTNDLLAQTYDQIIPANGTVPVGAHLLAAGVYQNLPVVAGSANGPIPLTLNPVVSSVTIAATPGTMHTLLPANFSVAVYAYDAGGNLIIAPAYVDANGNPTTIPLSVSSNANGSVTLTTTSPVGSGTSITVAGSGTAVTGTYNGNADVTANQSLSVSLTSSAAIATSGSLTIVGPTIEYDVLNSSITRVPSYAGIAAPMIGGTDQQFWFNNPFSSIITVCDMLSAGCSPYSNASSITGGLAQVGNDVYFTDSGGLRYWQESPFVNTFANLACGGSGLCSTSGNLAYWQKSNTFYYTNGGSLYSYLSPTSTQLNGFSCTTNVPVACSAPNFAGTAVDQSGGNVWFVDAETGGTGTVYEYSGGAFYTAPAPSAPVFDVALDSSGNAYVTEPAGNAILRYTTPATSGAQTTFTTTLGKPEYIATDAVNTPSQYIFFSETTASGIGIGAIDLATNTVSEAPLIALPGGAAGPLIENADGNIGLLHYASPNGEVMVVQP